MLMFNRPPERSQPPWGRPVRDAGSLLIVGQQDDLPGRTRATASIGASVAAPRLCRCLVTAFADIARTQASIPWQREKHASDDFGRKSRSLARSR